MTSSRHGPHALGFTRATMAGTEGCQAARRSKTQKAGLSWDHSLQLDWVNVEPLVTAGQLYGGEYVTESRTASRRAESAPNRSLSNSTTRKGCRV